MNGLSILLLLILILLFVVFIVGLFFLFIGLQKKGKKNLTTKTRRIFISIPIAVIVIVFLYDFLNEQFAKKPTNKDIVGTYHIKDASGLIAINQYRLYKLEFKKDGTFYLTPTPVINVCETGNYYVDWDFDFNELSFHCDKNVTTAHIYRNFSEFKIEFIIGDPDSGESIYFTKDK